MSVALIEAAVAALGPLVRDVAFVGGSSVQLWITDAAAPPARATIDVDVVIEVTGFGAYAAFGEQVRERGFEVEMDSHVICRWRHASGLVLDLMPTAERILGFANRWYPAAFAAAVETTLPGGAVIRAISPAYLVATKIEAFRDRGRGDYLASADFEDIARLIDGRAELVGEIAELPVPARSFVAESLATMRRDPLFEYGVAGVLLPDSASQARLPLVLDRISQIIGLA